MNRNYQPVFQSDCSNFHPHQQHYRDPVPNVTGIVIVFILAILKNFVAAS